MTCSVAETIALVLVGIAGFAFLAFAMWVNRR